MPNKLFQNWISIFGVIFLIGLLALVRMFENQLFYDPFLEYFKGDYQKLFLPDYDSWNLFWGLFFRYFVNAVFSLGILYFLFKDKGMIIFVSVLYLFLFLILITAFFSILHFFQNQENLLLFYVRRFLIQPLFLVVFIPAFYYQKLKN